MYEQTEIFNLVFPLSLGFTEFQRIILIRQLGLDACHLHSLIGANIIMFYSYDRKASFSIP